MPDITDFVNNLWRKITPSQNRILGSPEFQISKFFDLQHFEPDITDIVKHLERELTPSQTWTFKSGHGSSTAIHEQAQAEHKQARASTCNFFSDVGHFEPDITDFVNNLWRKITPFKNRILGSPKFQVSMFGISSQINTRKHEQIFRF